MDRFLLTTIGSLEGRTFGIVDTEDRYHRVKCWATSWAEGEQLVAYLNKGARDAQYWDELERDLKGEVAANKNHAGPWPLSAPRQGVKPVDGGES